MSILPPIAGQKRPPPTLLPAFEPLSSSPGFHRRKRQDRTEKSKYDHDLSRYPSPIPSSTTGIFSSPSPPSFHERSSENCKYPSLPERAPLSSVPTVTPPDDGEILRMGRSSRSSNYQLTSNRLISRVHVEARYIVATAPLEPNSIEIKCMGWNGLKIHCSGQTWELAKGDTFTSQSEFADIILDVQDARVLVSWPGKDSTNISVPQNNFWDDEITPSRRQNAVTPRRNAFQSSPIRCHGTMVSPVSPVSPSPLRSSISIYKKSQLNTDEPEAVQVYEDKSTALLDPEISESFSIIRPAGSLATLNKVESSELQLENPDEENDPFFRSFYPFSADISSQMAIKSSREFTRRPSPTPSPAPTPEPSTQKSDSSEVVHYLVNKLAFSPKSSIPLSDLLIHLPEDLKKIYFSHNNIRLDKKELQKLLISSPCIGEIRREGKDAAGQPLESQYYYIPEKDENKARRNAVYEIRKPSIRNCRKKHNVR